MNDLENKGALPEEAETEFVADIIVLTDEEGTDHEFELLGSTERNGVTYYALTEYATGEELLESDGELYIMKSVGEKDAELMLDLVEDDDEYNEIAKIFIELLADEYEITEE